MPNSSACLGSLTLRFLNGGVLVGRDPALQPGDIPHLAGRRQVRIDRDVRPLLHHAQEFLVDVAVTHAVRERIDIGLEQPFAILEVEDVRGDPDLRLVRLVDDGAVELRASAWARCCRDHRPRS